MSEPRVGVLALQGGVREHARMLEHVGARVVAVRRPAELEGVDALVIPGGESTAIERAAAGAGLLEPLRARVREGLPTLGTCAGLVLLADRIAGDGEGEGDGSPETATRAGAIGGLDVTIRRNAYGSQAQSFEADLALADDGADEASPARGVFIRAPRILRTGPGVSILATRAGGEPVAVAEGALLAAAYHPELSGDPRWHARLVRTARTAA